LHKHQNTVINMDTPDAHFWI